MDYDSMRVSELKEELRKYNAPVSGNKNELIERLNQFNLKDETIITLEDDDFIETNSTERNSLIARMRRPVYGPLNLGAIYAIVVSLLMLTTVLIIQPSWLGFGEDYEYELIEFDQQQVKIFAEELVALGHPDWEGRMSGTTEESNTAQYISNEFVEMGYEAEINEFQVPMHHVNSEPSFRLCVQGLGGISPCDGPAAFGSQVTSFQHRVDYVIQGFSGQSAYMFNEDIPVTDLGNGTDEALWQSATGTIGYVRGDSSKVGNTELYSNAAINDLAGLISVNKNYNCGKIEGTDCVPIFKGTNFDAIAQANGGNAPSHLL